MEGVTEFYSCLIQANCSGTNMPAGGEIFAVIALAAASFGIPHCRKLLAKFFLTSKQGIFALTLGSMIFFVDGGRALPFSIALAVALLCFATLIPNIALLLGNTLNRIGMIKRLPKHSMGTFIITLGGFFYIAAQISSSWIERRNEELFKQNESKVLVAFVVPSLDTSSVIMQTKKEKFSNNIQRLLYEEMNKVIKKTFGHIENVEVEPAIGNDPNYFKTIYDKFASTRENPSVLLSHRKGLGSPVDVVIEPMFYISEVSQKEQVGYSFRIRKFNHTTGKIDRWPGMNEEWINLKNLQEDHRIAALVATAMIAVHLNKQNTFNEILSFEKHSAIWKRLIDSFNNHYVMFDHIKNIKSTEAANDPNCLGEECVIRWIIAYSEAVTDKQAEERVKMDYRTSQTVYKKSAQSGTKQQ